MRAGTGFSQLLNLRVFQQYRRIADVAGRGLGRLSWAESAPTMVASGGTGVRAIAVVPLRARKWHHRPKQASTEAPAERCDGWISDGRRLPLFGLAASASDGGPTSNATLRVPKFDYVISNTAILAAMPRSECSLGDGVMPLVSSSRAHPPWPTTRPVAKIEVEVARPCTREAMLTVWPK
jgi:hypothetical protein